MHLWRLLKLLCMIPCAFSIETFSIGWQAPNGPASVYDISNHTFNYVGEQLGVRFEVQPYTMDAELIKSPADFIFSSPTACYCAILNTNQQPLVTINNLDPLGRPYSSLSGDILTLNTSGITRYADLEGKTVGAGQFSGLTTLQSEFNLLIQNNFSLFTQTKAFVGYTSSAQIIQAILNKTIDVGFAESSQLTVLAAQGLDVSALSIVQPMMYANSPFPSSTPTYSSSVLSASPNINNTFRTALVKALLELPPDSPPVKAGGYFGFVIPQSFLLIRKLMQATGSLNPSGNQCTTFNSIYSFVTCPTGYKRKADTDLSTSCVRAGFTCPAESLFCICSPCEIILGPAKVGNITRTNLLIMVSLLVVGIAVVTLLAIRIMQIRKAVIPWNALNITDIELGRNAKGRVLRGTYRSVPVAVKRAIASKSCHWTVFDHDDMPDRSPCIDIPKTPFTCLHDVILSFYLHLGVFSATQQLILQINKASHVRHNNILPILGCSTGEHGDEVLVVTEFAEKGTLAEMLDNITIAKDENMLMGWAYDVARGVAHLHCLHPPVYTRNIRAHHIFLDEDMRARIGVSYTPFKHNTVWNPPEVIKGKAQSAASNAYKFGMLLYQLAFQRPPFSFISRTEQEIVDAIVDADSFNAADVQPRAPRNGHPLWPLMQSCWASNPGHRPSFESIVLELETFLSSVASSSQVKRHQSNDSQILDSMLPASVVQALRDGKDVQPEHYESCSIFFSDIVGFTSISALLPPARVMQMLDRLYKAFDRLVLQYDLFKVETIGDAYMVASNIQRPHPDDHAARLVRFAMDAIELAKTIPVDLNSPKVPIKIRCGIHSGKCVASVIGSTNPRYCLFGDTINFASRMESNSQVYRLQISDDCRNLVQKQDPQLALRICKRPGKIPIKGKGRHKTHWVLTEQEFAEKGYQAHDSDSVSESMQRMNVDAGKKGLGSGSLDAGMRRSRGSSENLRIDIPDPLNEA